MAAGLVLGLLGAGLLHLLRRRRLLDQLLATTALVAAAVVLIVLLQMRAQLIAGSGAAVIVVASAAGLGLACAFARRVTGPVTAELVLANLALRRLTARDDPTSRSAAARSGPMGAALVALPKELDQFRTDLSEALAGLTAARDREQLAEEARRELVSFLSHDLRTPLAGLRALTEGLEDGVIEDVPRALGHLRTTIVRMSGLVEDLFALTQLQGPRPTKPKTMVSLTELILDVASELAALGAERRVPITTDLPVGDQLAVLGVAEDLNRALTNLVTNALRHTASGAAVRLVGRRGADGQIQIAVVDGCGGIPEQDLPMLFGTGWRGAVSASGDDGGAGLGLAIARGVMHAHEGQIDVHNVEGGCRFEMELPARPVSSSAEPTSI